MKRRKGVDENARDVDEERESGDEQANPFSPKFMMMNHPIGRTL